MYTAKIFQMLMEIYIPQDIVKWLQSPQPLLDFQVPEKMMEEGKRDEVYIVLKRMMDGAYV